MENLGQRDELASLAGFERGIPEHVHGLTADPIEFTADEATRAQAADELRAWRLEMAGELRAVVADYTSSVAIRLGDGLGGFDGKTNVAIDGYSVSVAIGDFNRDGKQDIAVASLTRISILLGNGTGGFTNGATFTAGIYIQGIAAVSLRSNALIDLLVTDSTARTVRLFYGNDLRFLRQVK